MMKPPRVEQYGQPSPSRRVCRRLHRCSAAPHRHPILYLTIKLLSSVEMGSTLFQEDVLTQSGRGQTDYLRLQHLCQIRYQNQSVDVECRAVFHSAKNTSTSSHYCQLGCHMINFDRFSSSCRRDDVEPRAGRSRKTNRVRKLNSWLLHASCAGATSEP